MSPSAFLRSLLARLYDWLDCTDCVDHADLIFVLAGRQTRKVHALQLFAQGKADKLLVSVGRYEVRRFKTLMWPTTVDVLQAVVSVPPAQRHLFVAYEQGQTAVSLIRPGALGTWREIEALAVWLESRPDIGSIVAVSSAAHLRRVRLCCSVLLNSTARVYLTAAEGDDRSMHRDFWWRDRHSRRIVLLEFAKLLCYWPLLQIRRIAGRPVLRVI